MRAQKPKCPEAVRIVLISDTHELHREIDVPDGDILIHAGDFSMMSRSAAAIQDFDDWLGEQPHRFKVVVPGNHEFAFVDPARRGLVANAHLLINDNIDVMGLRIWGSPTTQLLGAAFGRPSALQRRALYSQIPADTDVLITHGAPYGILDRAPGTPHHEGCRELLDAVVRVKPKLHVFGHVHSCYGLAENDHTTFVNAALLGRDGGIEQPPVVLQMRTT